MIRSDFSIELPAKWVLAGEHAVLRGGMAIAFPYPKYNLKLTYKAGVSKSSQPAGVIIPPGPFRGEIESLINLAVEYLKVPKLSGEIEIQSSIPPGAGLGSSAALSLAISALVMERNGLSIENIPEWKKLATHLENLFHGKSSGMDVSVIAEGAPLLFVGGETKETMRLNFKRLPHFELFDSGMRSSTQKCIATVQALRESQPELADRLDAQMKLSVKKASEALEVFQSDESSGAVLLKDAMNSAQDCFEQWGLVTPELQKQKNALLSQGALSIKLTGAGLGGFWAVLWPSERSSSAQNFFVKNE